MSFGLPGLLIGCNGGCGHEGTVGHLGAVAHSNHVSVCQVRFIGQRITNNNYIISLALRLV